jgi:hypothetical protein
MHVSCNCHSVMLGTPAVGLFWLFKLCGSPLLMALDLDQRLSSPAAYVMNVTADNWRRRSAWLEMHACSHSQECHQPRVTFKNC